MCQVSLTEFMRTSFPFCSLLLPILGLFIFADPLYAQTTHCSPISADEYWTDETVHVVNCNLTIESNATLTIQAGTVVKFAPYAQISVKGQLVAAGTADDIIVFTSLSDDEFGGDTDGESQTPTVGDWGNIKFKSGSDGVVSRSLIRYSGRDSGFGGSGSINDGPILLTNSSPTLSYISFEHNYLNGAEIDSGGIWSTAGNSDRWDSNTVVYVVDKSNVIIPESQTLFISAGAKLKFAETRSMEVHGYLNVAGEEGKAVTFTSWHDDSVCGTGANEEPICDTDNSPNPATVGDWGNIQFNDDSDDKSVINRAIIRYSGGASGSLIRDAPIWLDNASPQLNYISFEHNYLNGAALRGGIDWQSDSWDSTTVLYVIEKLDLAVPAGATLTISTGVKVKLGDDVSIDVYGQLTAIGATESPIYFTSLSDNSVCGIGADNEQICDTSNGRITDVAAAGDWGNIRFHPGSSDESEISRTVIQYSGSDNGHNIDDGPIWLDNASPTLALLTLNHNYLNGVEIAGSTMWETDEWDNDTVVHVIEDGDLTIPAGEKLTIKEGVIVKMASDNSLIVDGNLSADGTESQPIIFTSIHDALGCGIGAADELICNTQPTVDAEPAMGDWGMIHFKPLSDDSSRITHAAIRYSGSNLGRDINDGAIYLDNASPILSYISFEHNYINGAELRGRTEWQTITWANPSVIYVLEEGDITIPISDTLTIGAGMGVKIGNNSSLIVEGELIAIGSGSEPITLSSIYDNSLCGQNISREKVCETHSQSSMVDPKPGDWGKIYFPEGERSVSTLSRAVVRYSGTGNDRNDNAAILLDNAAPILSYITFRDNEVNGVSLSTGESTIWRTNRWENNTVVYVIQESDISIPDGEKLTIAQGVRVKLDKNISLLIDGQISVLGTRNKPVYFSSIKDDSVCGVGAFDEAICDTNGDDSLEEESVAQIGDWGQIRFSSSSASSSTIERAIIRYSGNNSGISVDDSAIYLDGASPAILYSVLTQNYRGIETQNRGVPALTCNDIFDNLDGGIHNGNDLTDGAEFAIDSDIQEGVIVARNHWWGDPSGPFHETNPDGHGEKITNGVLFSPWESSACMGQDTPDRQADSETDLQVEIESDHESTSGGAILHFTINILNIGPDNATETRLLISLPNQVMYISATYPGGTCSETDGFVTCNIGNLSTNNPVAVSLILSVDANLDGDLAISSTVSSAEIDPNTANNSDVNVVGQTDDKPELYLPYVSSLNR